MISRRLPILLIFFFATVLTGNPFLPYFNKLYKTHKLIENQNYTEAKTIIQKLKTKKDSSDCVLWYEITRIYLIEKKYDSAFFSSEKALSLAIVQSQNSTKSNQIKGRYGLTVGSFDSLFAQQVEKIYNIHRSTNPDNIDDFGTRLTQSKINQYYINLFKSKLTFFKLRDSALTKSIKESNHSFCPNSILSLNKQVYYFELTQDTLIFRNAIQTNSISVYKNYLKEYWQSIDQQRKENYQFHQLSFFKIIEDSLYNLAFNQVLKTNTESAYLNFAKEYPRATQKDSAVNFAENIAYLEAKSINTANQYNYYLSKYPRAKHKAQVEYLLRYLKVIPVPYLTKEMKYVYVDSVTSETWTDSVYDFAYPYAAKYHKKWYSNGSMLMPGCALVMNLDEFETPEFYYIEKDGSRVNKNSYDEIIQFSSNLAFVQKAERYGIINSLGVEVIPCKFQRIYFDTALGIGAVYNGKAWGFINTLGKLITPIHFTNFYSPDLNLTMNADLIELPKIIIPVSLNNLWGYIEPNGQVCIDYKYKQAWGHKNGVAIIETTESKWQLINRFGDVISGDYDNMQDLENGFIKITKIQDGKKKYGILAKPFKGFFPQANLNIKQLFNLSQSNHLSLTKEILSSNFDEILVVQNPKYTGFAIKQKAGYQIFDTSAKILNKLPLPNLNVLAQKLFVIKEKKTLKWFNFISKNISNISGDDIGVLNNDLITVNNKGAWNLYKLDETAVQVKNEKGAIFKDFESIVPAEKEGYIMAQKKGLWGLISESGNLILDFKYSDIYFTDNTSQFIVKIPNATNPDDAAWGVFNTSLGKYVIDPVFEGISNEDFSGYWLVPYNEKNAWLDSKGNLYAD